MGDIMSRKTIDRTGETRINNFGSQMIIIRYRMNRDIDVYFQNMIIFLKEQRIKVLKRKHYMPL